MFAPTDLLKFKITAIVAGVLLVALLGVFTYYKVQVTALNHTITQQRERIGALEVEVATVTAANKLMETAVKAQNDKVDKLIKDFKEASAQADKAIFQAQLEAGKWKAKYSKALTAPPVSSDECVDLASKVDAYLKLRAEGGL